mmetsp:Transcript_68679/g.210611  ORF Transcript_68679/g.210611 Transcript_68679/m.210611 type:complete len:116 (-) Transcript_68679:49-396(-)
MVSRLAALGRDSVEAPLEAAAWAWDLAEDGTLMVLQISFIALRIAIALRSSKDRSLGILWGGLAVAVVSRCITENVHLVPFQLSDVVTIARLGARELLHTAGLHVVLRIFPNPGD